jgi:hypothetical protein
MKTAPDSRPGHGWILPSVAIALVLLKLWLVSAQTIQAIGNSPHDDRLFLNQAETILQGRWLGDYTVLTLAKGPFYPVFIACACLLHVPLFTAQQLLYAAGCGLVVRALRPHGLRDGFRLGLFAALLFNPVTYDANVLARVMRQDIISALTLLIMAGLLGLHFRREGPPRRMLPWSLLLGCSLAAFWLTREEGVWLLPALMLPWAGTVWSVVRGRAPGFVIRLTLLALPAVLWAAGMLAVSTLNWRHYGVFTTCEFRHPAFKAAYKALVRVKPAHWHPAIPVARETRKRIYAVSPAFAELKPHLEGQLGKNWAATSQQMTHMPPAKRELAGGWFMWALRDAVHDSGHADTAVEAMAFYERLAAEVNSAFDERLIEAGPRGIGFMPPWNKGYLRPVSDAFWGSVHYIFSPGTLGVHTPPSVGDAASLAMFADLTRGRLSPAEDSPSALPAQDCSGGIRLRILGVIGQVWAWMMPWAFGFGFITGLSSVVLSITRRRTNYFGLLWTGLLGSCVALALIVALFHSTSCPAIHQAYLTGGYAFLVMLPFVGWLFWREILECDTRTRSESKGN